MLNDSEFTQLMARVDAGSEEAIMELADIYTPHIIGAVRRCFGPRIRQKFDSQDVAQTLWASLLLDRSELLRLKSSTELIAFLIKATRNKVANKARHLRAQKRSYYREEHLDVSSASAVQGNRQSTGPLHSREPTPSSQVSAREQWDYTISQASGRNRQIIELRMQSLTFQEIAAQLDIHEQTARRAVQKFLDAFETR